MHLLMTVSLTTESRPLAQSPSPCSSGSWAQKALGKERSLEGTDDAEHGIAPALKAQQANSIKNQKTSNHGTFHYFHGHLCPLLVPITFPNLLTPCLPAAKCLVAWEPVLKSTWKERRPGTAEPQAGCWAWGPQL